MLDTTLFLSCCYPSALVAVYLLCFTPCLPTSHSILLWLHSPNYQNHITPGQDLCLWMIWFWHWLPRFWYYDPLPNLFSRNKKSVIPARNLVAKDELGFPRLSKTRMSVRDFKPSPNPCFDREMGFARRSEAFHVSGFFILPSGDSCNFAQASVKILALLMRNLLHSD